MRSTVLRSSLHCAVMLLLATGCDSSSTTGPGDLEAGTGDVRNPSQPDAARDVVGPGKDARDVGGGSPVDGPARDVPAAEGPALPARDGGQDGGSVGPSEDAPLGGPEAGPVDGQGGEVPPLVYPDGGLVCGLTGAVCLTAADCCGLACVANRCAASACLSDGTACAAGAQCCSTQCGADGKCRPLNPTCKTAGNACATGADCCSGVCNANKQCAQPGQVSYCAQVGDICRGDNQCCTGVCNLVAGAAAGTCAAVTTSSSCQIDGTVCNGCGTCCSHFCGPFGLGGPKICQPASGCHVQGDLCRKDGDCCGGDATSGLPGAGLVKCEPDPVYGARIGSCGGPKASNCPGGVETCKNACNPEGNVCHYKDTAVCAGDTTSKRNDCCACISGKECCKLDSAGIPRCNALTSCVPVGGNCAFSDECCNHLPCVPDPVTGKLTCGSTCVPSGGTCTTNADCCTGMLCEVQPGSLAGVCTVPTQPPVIVPDGGAPEPDGGVPDPDAAVPDASTEPDAPPVCAFYGQACSLTIACCGGMPCVDDQFNDCTANATRCVCFLPE